MSATATFERQHRDLEATVTAFSAALDSCGREHAVVQRALLSKLAGQLRMHLAMEDESLYPRLLAHANAEVRATAEHLRETVGGLSASLRAHLEKWPSAIAIGAAQAHFVVDSRRIILLLKHRIALEERRLFPLLRPPAPLPARVR